MESLKQFLVRKKKESSRKIGKMRGDLDEKTILYITEKVILEEYGRRGTENVIPKRYKEKILYIYAKQSVWANEILLEKEKFIVLLNKKLGRGAVQEIRI